MLHPRVVHASTPTGFPNQGSDGSYTGSTCSHGLPDRHDIFGRIHIAVVGGAALRTGPLTHRQRQGVQQIAAGRTGFTTRKESVDLDDRFGFGFEHADGRADRGIREGTGKAVVLNHAPEMQVFDVDDVEPACQHRTHLVEGIAPSIGNLFMQPRHAAGLPEATVRPLLCSGQAPLGTGQVHRAPGKMFRVRDGLAGREGSQTADAEVDPNRVASLDPFHNRDFHDHRHVVPARRVTGHGDRTGIGWHGAAQAHSQDAQFGERQPLRGRVEPKGIPLIGGTVPHTTFLLKGGVRATFGEEIDERGMEMAQRLLKRDCRHIIKKGHLRFTLQCRQFLVTPCIGQPLAALEGQCSGGQHAVVDQAATAERASQMLFLFGGRVCAKVPATFHGLQVSTLAYNNQDAIYPRHEWRGFTAESP